jgi:YHS domain-containing protein
MRTLVLCLMCALLAFGCGKKEGEGTKKDEAAKTEKGAEKKASEGDEKVEAKAETAIPKEALGKTEVDPVCEMNVKVEEGTPHHEHDGKHYYFCREGCRDAFSKAPDKFLK